MDGLSASGLADLAGVSEAEVARLVELGILVARDGPRPFRESDVPKVRLAVACELARVGPDELMREDELQAVLVSRSAGGHGGVPVKWLGDGVMVHFREPAGAVRSALDLVEQLPPAGLPPAHAGVAAWTPGSGRIRGASRARTRRGRARRRRRR